MRKINRQYHGKRIYRLWFQYMKQLESTKDPWFSQYRQWDLEWIKATAPDTGSISKEGFDIWWDESRPIFRIKQDLLLLFSLAISLISEFHRMTYYTG